MTTNPNRVSKGVPTGGQFAASERGEATGIALADTPVDPFADWLPPGAHQVVACERCANDEARRDDPGCRFCDGGKVTTDRYGQVPWHPEAPGTQVAYEDPRDGEWKAATMTARATESNPEVYAAGILADGEVREIRMRDALPVHAAQAAARHGVNSHEMIEEAACEMNIGIEPSHDEIRAFLARIDDGYVEDIARSAAEFRTARSEELREEGRTGPALDYSADLAPADSEAIDRAVEACQPGSQNYRSMTYVTAREHWHGYTVVRTPSGRIATYNDTAWDKPDEQPMLPWSAPEGIPVAHVALDGTVTRVDRKGSK